MGFWDRLRDISGEIMETPEYWYDAGKKKGSEGGLVNELFSDFHYGQMIGDLREELREAYRRGYEDGVREREEREEQ